MHSAPITEGWSAQLGGNPWPWVVRCTLRGGAGVLPSSVIVKLRRPVDHLRSEPERLVRLPKLELADVLHPMGFSRRGQVLDAFATTRQSARRSGSLPRMAGWLGDLETALRRRWPHLPPAQAAYPAFQEYG